MKRRVATHAFWTVLLLQLSGCVIYTPFEVIRFGADYNTERECNAQVECFDHLPPKTPRVRLMRWGYNIGPTNAPPKGTLGLGTGVWKDHLLFWKHLGAKDCPAYPTETAGVAPNSTSTLPQESAPTLPPPAPGAESPDLELGPAPQTGSEMPAPETLYVIPMGYQAIPSRSPARVKNSSSWIFSKSSGADRLAKPAAK